MPCEKIFWKDPYLTQISARLTSAQDNTITVDRTIFYAPSGGQDSDSGTIEGCRVLQARKDGLEIFYTMEGPHEFNVGDEVSIEIDWERRYRLMRLHFAAEIVLELVYKNFNRPEKIGANIHQDKARLDFAWEGKISDVFPFIEEEAARLINAELPIRSEFSDRVKEQRYWEIDGFAKVSCGGTHIRNTKEIGVISLKRNNIGKGKERIEIYLTPSQ
jgi:Ser-tRNA(Ala) deacylase AlaX